MTSKSMRSFAGGLIVAATLCGAVYFSGPAKATTKQTAEKLSNEEMKTLLAEEGYVIYSEKEWDQLEAEKEPAKEAPNKNEETKQDENVIYRTILNVSLGMTSIDVGRSLEKAKIIDNARAFSTEVEKRGLSSKLKPGIYEVESGMNMDQILSVMFKK
ncbi:endolytic transglycosylase MltG [Cytobacillus depressus]|uniref:Endolytic transglycosylase MltG n=1 Tax=Cytobacillus depressus TaxID=1602942 RepID=A0A6L3VBB9_9BACI|nr:endolytic transglycosylase MltG [Cytobacillus depressus]KAB2338063.1 endolytic transglycosylase MltG [Cytobacillus depressus]